MVSLKSWIIAGAAIGAVTGSQVENAAEAYHIAKSAISEHEMGRLSADIERVEADLEKLEPGFVGKLLGSESSGIDKVRIKELKDNLAKLNAEHKRLEEGKLTFFEKLRSMPKVVKYYKFGVQFSKPMAYGAGIGAGAGLLAAGALALRRRKQARSRPRMVAPRRHH